MLERLQGFVCSDVGDYDSETCVWYIDTPTWFLRLYFGHIEDGVTSGELRIYTNHEGTEIVGAEIGPAWKEEGPCRWAAVESGDAKEILDFVRGQQKNDKTTKEEAGR